MVENTELIRKLGSLGLLERLDEPTRKLGLANHKDIIDAVRNKKYEREPHIGDDFVPDTGLYNAVGAIYPLLDREQRDDAVRAHLRQFDQVNNMYVSLNHTPFIREPLLLADITILRAGYWPGLKDEKDLWKNRDKDVIADVIAGGLFDPSKVQSDFLVAYALLRSDFTSFGDDFVVAANPDFLNRVLKGIVALRFAKREDPEEIEAGRNRLYKILPESVHDRIEPLRLEADWIN